MQSLLDVQKAFYAPREGPPMLLYHEPNPLRRPKRKRRKLAKGHVPIPQRPKDILPSNFPASDLPEGFPPEFAFRALAAYSLLRTLSRELRLSPFTPNVFLRALYLPFPSKLIGQVHASLLRILLASLNMGYSCKPKGNNIPDVIRKKRRMDGIRWPLRAGDNLTFLDNFTWPLFYDDYVHLTADILWAMMNSDENHADFRNIGMPDLTGMVLEEDIREQEEEKSLMSKPAKIANTLVTNEKGPYALESLSRSSRSARRTKVAYTNFESDDSDEEVVEEDVIADEEEEEDYMDKRKSNSKKRGRSTKKSLPKATPKLPAKKQPSSAPAKASIHARGTKSAQKGANGSSSNPRQKQPTTKASLPTSASKGKKTNRMLPSSRSKKKTPPTPQDGKKSPPAPQDGNPKKRSAGAGRKLPTHSGSTPAKKPKKSPLSGSKVEWVEEGPSPSHFKEENNTAAKSSEASNATPTTFPNKAMVQQLHLQTPAPTAGLPMGAQAARSFYGMPTATATALHGMSRFPYGGPNLFMGQNAYMSQQYNPISVAQANIAQQVQLAAASSFHSSGYNHISTMYTPVHKPSTPNPHAGASRGLPHCNGNTNSRNAHQVSKEVASILHDFIGGRLETSFNLLKSSSMEVIELAEEIAEEPATTAAVKEGGEPVIKLESDNVGEPTSTSKRSGQALREPDQPPATAMVKEEGAGAPTKTIIVDKPMNLTGGSVTASTATSNVVEKGNVNCILNTTDKPSSTLLSSATNFAPVNAESDNITASDNNRSQGVSISSQGEEQRTKKPGEETSLENAATRGILAAASESGAESLLQTELIRSVPAQSSLLGNYGNKKPVHITASQNSTFETSTEAALQLSNAVALSAVTSSTPGTCIAPANAGHQEVEDQGPNPVASAVASAPSTSTIAAKLEEPRAENKVTLQEPSNDSLAHQSTGQNELNERKSVTDFKGNTTAPREDISDDQSVQSEQSSLPFADDDEQWPQFQPIRSMRAGLPYHRLPLEEKLAVLEFLIDELLAMGTFASVFTERNANSMHSSNYGALPSKAEFDELENEDECAVCKGEGELLCCDGCVSSYHRSCIDMRQNEVLPDGRWLCPECELVDPAKYGPLKGGRKSSLDWFTVDDIHAAVRLKSASEEDTLANPITLDETTATNNSLLQPNPAPTTEYAPSVAKETATTSLVMNLEAHPGLQNAKLLGSIDIPEQAGLIGTQNGFGVVTGTPALPGTASAPNTNHADAATSLATTKEYLVVHGFVFTRSRGVSQEEMHTLCVGGSVPPFEPLPKNLLCQVLKSIGAETSLRWPLAQVPFACLEAGVPLTRGIEHPKVLALDSKTTFDPSAYASKYRKTPLAKSAFPGANFHSIQLLLSDYEYACNTCNLKRLSDRLSPDMSTDRMLAQSLKAEANLFDPYQLIRDYMLKLENLLNRAHLLNEFWGTRNKEIKAHVWQMNVRNCRSIPRLAQLLLMLVDACHCRAFTEQWFSISGSKEADHPLDEAPTTDSRTLYPLPSDWTLQMEKRKRKWERSTLSNVLSLLAQEGRDVEKWVYGEGKGASNRRKRKQTVTGRSPYSPSRILVSSKDSKKFVVDELPTDKAALANRDIAGLVMKDKSKRPTELDSPNVISVQVLQQAIDRRVTTGIPVPQDQEKGEVDPSQEETSASAAASSRRSRRSGRLQTKKESPEDFIANVIAESGKAEKDLSMSTLIEAQEMSKLVELKEVSAIPFGGTGHWPVAGRLLFDPVGSLCKSEMRRLGRNAGKVVAQHVSYSGSYEVGEVSHFHVWRKNMQKCFSYEQLLLLIRALESNLDKPTITSCEALARRTPHARSQIAKAVRCTLKDTMTGVDHHFILQKNKHRGSWISSLTLDLSPFMVERSERRERQQEAFTKKLREKSMEEARAREAARLKAAAEAAARTQALIREQAAARAKAAKEQAEAKARAIREKAEAKAAAKAAKAAQKAKEKAEKAEAKAKLKAEREAAKEAQKQAARARILQQQQQQQPMATSHHMSQQTQNVVAIQNDVQRVLAAHKMATQQLIRESSNAGLSFVPEAEIKKLRMKAASDLQNCYRGRVPINSDTLFAQLGKAESDALKAETEAKKASVDRKLHNMAGRDQTASNNQGQQQGWPQTKQAISGSHQQQQAGNHMYPSPAVAHAMQNRSLGNVAASNTNTPHHPLNQSTGQGQLGGSNFSVSPMQLQKPKGQATASYGGTPSGQQYSRHKTAYNPPGGFPSQNPRSMPSQDSNRSTMRAGASTSMSAVGGGRYNATSQKPQGQPNNSRGMDWGANPQLVPNHLLQALGGDTGKQLQSAQMQSGNNHLMGNGGAWNLPRSAQDARGRDSSRESQMADLARLANGGANVQHLMQQHARSGGGIPSQQQAAANPRAGGVSGGHYQEMLRGNDYRTGLPSSSNRLQNAMNNFPGGHLYQNSTLSGGRPSIPGYSNNHSIYGGAAGGGFPQDIAGRDERRPGAQPQQQQVFDFEPTPIAEMRPNPPQNAYNSQQQRQHPQQHQHQQHQWYQR